MIPTLSTAACDLGSPPSGASGRSWIATLASVPETRWAASAAVLFAIGGVAQLAGAPTAVFWALYLACYATGGWQPARSGLQALREGTLDVDDGEQVVDTADLEVGDVVLVRPWERVGADGAVVHGASEVDQASITGEPLPVLRERGDKAFAGTANGTGVLRIEVTRAAHIAAL